MTSRSLRFFSLLGWIYTLLFTSSILAAPASTSKMSSQPLDGIVAIVNDGIITQSQLRLAENRFKHQAAIMQAQLTDAQIKQKALQELINQQLILQIAKQQKITATPQDVDKAIQKLASLNNLPLSQLNTELKKEGITMNQFRQDISNQIVGERIKGQIVAGKISITAADIAQYRAQHLAELQRNNRYHLLDFTIPLNDNPSATELAQANKQASQLIIKLKRNEDVDSVGVNYEDLGWRSFADLPDLFVQPVSGLSVKGVSSPVRAPNGIHILKVLEIQSQGPQPTAEELKRMVWEQKADIQLAKTVTKLRKMAYIKVIN